jgi:hypothetical protein
MTLLWHMFTMSLPHMFFTAAWVLDLCWAIRVVSSTCVSSSCSSAYKKWNCSKNRLSQFEQFHFLCWAVENSEKVLSNCVSSYCNLSSWYAPDNNAFIKKKKINDIQRNVIQLCIIFCLSWENFNFRQKICTVIIFLTKLSTFINFSHWKNGHSFIFVFDWI